MYSLYSYQEKCIPQVAQLLADGHKSVLLQGATGVGKTVVLSTIAQRYILRNPDKHVLILVHREELVLQTRDTLFSWYGINGQAIDQKCIHPYQRPVYVGMCETVFRRLTRNPKYLPEIGLVIYDEAHRGEFKKLHALFPNSLAVGFTATPLGSSKKDPLKNYFSEIVCSIDIPDLIEIWKQDNTRGLVQNRTYRPKNVNRDKLKINKGEFDEHQMSEVFSNSRHVQNVVFNYTKYVDGTKAIVFNCGVEHSKLVAEAFVRAGYPCRHLDASNGSPDGTMDAKAWRKDCLQWLRITPGAILCSIDILTTGFDEQSIETIVVNRATTSLVLWIQMTGRGARVYPGKKRFTIIDMGDNVTSHGDWCDARDWADIFHNPPKPREKVGAPPCKECPACESIISAGATVCKYCGYVYPVKPIKYDTLPVELELVTKNMDVELMAAEAENAGSKPYSTLFRIGTNLATQAKYRIGKRPMTDAMADHLLSLYYEKAKEWCHLKNHNWNNFHKNLTRNHLFQLLGKYFNGWQHEEVIPIITEAPTLLPSTPIYLSTVSLNDFL